MDLVKACYTFLSPPDLARLINDVQQDFSCYLVGGALRDLALGLNPKDPDFAVSCPAEILSEQLIKKGYKIVPTGLKHGTILVVLEEHHVEFTTFGASGAASKTCSSIIDDLERRDFTINSLAYDPCEQKIIDPHEGLKDIQNKVLRCVGDPAKRFSEDPLRIMRLLRFGPAQGRSVHEATADAAFSMAPALSSVSVERIRSELEKFLLSDYPAEALRMLEKLNLLPIVLPEALPSVGFEQNEYHTEDVWGHTLSVVARTPKVSRLRLAALFHDLGKPATMSVGEDGRRHFFKHENVSADLCKQAMERLRFSDAQIKEVLSLVSLHMRPLTCGETGVRRLMRDLGNLLEDWKLFKAADATPTLPYADFEKDLENFNSLIEKELARSAESSVFSRLAVDGNDLISLGYAQGQKLGSVLKALAEHVLEYPDTNNREALLNIAKEKLNDTQVK